MTTFLTQSTGVYELYNEFNHLSKGLDNHPLFASSTATNSRALVVQPDSSPFEPLKIGPEM
jgi:hypothetical protein